MTKRRTAVVAGATGLVGGELVRRLLADDRWRRIVALTRRPLPVDRPVVDPRLVTAEAAFERLDDVLSIDATDRPLAVFCCLGTTIRQAGSQQAFRRVDHDHVVALARWARSVAAERVIVVSALGADPSSAVFYNRVKGETERDLQALRLPSLVIVRPSLLAGSRREFRLGERLALAITRPLGRLLPAGVRPVDAADVAQSMIDAALAGAPPALIESAAMQGASRAG